MAPEASYVCKLSPELKARAEELLGETDAKRAACIQNLRDWLKKQPHLKCRTDDEFLLMYLRCTKFSVEKAKEKIDMYLTLKTALPEFYSGWDPRNNKIMELLELGICLPLPDYDHKGRKVLLIRPGVIEASRYDPAVQHKLGLMVAHIMQQDEQTIINGIVLMFDAQGVTMTHLTAAPMAMQKKMNKCWEDASPYRPQVFHQVNLQPFLASVFQTITSFMKEKMRKRLRIHTDMESLYKDMPKYCLPKEYGGDSYTVQELIVEWKEKVLARRDEFLEEEKFKADESKRPGKPKTSVDLFGLEGSFTKLNVD